MCFILRLTFVGLDVGRGLASLSKTSPNKYQNTELTVNDQTWIGGIAGLRNLERRRAEDMPTSDRLLFHQLRLGLIDPRPNYDNPKDMGYQGNEVLGPLGRVYVDHGG